MVRLTLTTGRHLPFIHVPTSTGWIYFFCAFPGIWWYHWFWFETFLQVCGITSSWLTSGPPEWLALPSNSSSFCAVCILFTELFLPLFPFIYLFIVTISQLHCLQMLQPGLDLILVSFQRCFFAHCEFCFWGNLIYIVALTVTKNSSEPQMWKVFLVSCLSSWLSLTGFSCKVKNVGECSIILHTTSSAFYKMSIFPLNYFRASLQNSH